MSTELESSLDGALSFFQNLRRSLGTLEAETNAQNDRLREIAASVATLQQDWQTDHQALTGLANDAGAQASQLGELRNNNTKLDTQISTVETQITSFQSEHQALQKTLADLANDLRTQREQDQKVSVEQQAASLARIEALEQQLSAQTRALQELVAAVQGLTDGAREVQEQVTSLGALSGQQTTQISVLEKASADHTAHFTAIDDRLDTLNNAATTNANALSQAQAGIRALTDDASLVEDRVCVVENKINEQATQLTQLAKNDAVQERLDQMTTRIDAVEAATSGIQALREHVEEQQTRFDNLSGSVADIWQDGQTLQEHLTQLEASVEEKGKQLADVAQAKQDLLKQQERLRHIEALVNKVAGDTNSTRQILNVLQADLTSHGDLLREFDQSWRAAQELSGNAPAPVAEAPAPAAPAPAASVNSEELATVRRDVEDLQQKVSTAQAALTSQDEKLTGLHSTLQEQLKAQQDRCEQLAASIANLPAPSEPAPVAAAGPNPEIVTALHNAIVAQADALTQVQGLVQEQVTAQQERFTQLEAALTSLQQASAAPAPEPTPVAAPAPAAGVSDEQFTHLQVAVVTQTQNLSTLQGAVEAQFKTHQSRLEQLNATMAELMKVVAATPAPAAPVETAPVETAPVETAPVETAPVEPAPVPVAGTGDAAAPASADLSAVQEALTAQTAALATMQSTVEEQLKAQQDRLTQMDAAITALKNQSGSGSEALIDDVTAIQGTLAVHIVALNDFRETANQRLKTVENLGIAKELESIREHLAKLDTSASGAPADGTVEGAEGTAQTSSEPAATTAAPAPKSTPVSEAPAAAIVSTDLAMFQKAISDLEGRIGTGEQAVANNIEQVRGLQGEFRALQQNLVALDVLPEQMRAFYKSLSEQEKQSAEFKAAIGALQQSVQSAQSAAPATPAAPAPAAASVTTSVAAPAMDATALADLEAKVEKQRDQIGALMAALESVQQDTRTSQEKVVTMAANVAKRIFEFQDKLTISETVQTERLQEAEQKLIQLQAALDTLQTTLKGRSWFKMPATFTTIMLVVGTTFLGLLARVLWTLS